MTNNNSFEVATFAGGCFWCMVQPFDTQPGIKEVIAGYTDGNITNPTYEEVCSGETGHVEAVQITYDPSIYSYRKLVELYWQLIDPTDDGGQFTGRGSSYLTTIFYHNEEQRFIAEETKQALIDKEIYNKPIVTTIKKAKPFYKAEEYHQYYYAKNPDTYAAFKERSGRAAFFANEKHKSLKEF